ncbi:unnamed protein product [Phytomonas sp. EM1]|nr:unnamed protein product [Phytomonas sp. EM1]|eukprot:CCW62161.1 unnamed protein product [Phytomonas sp. isolate EM1]
MSSSDDESWMVPLSQRGTPAPNPATGGMMLARQEALRRQRTSALATKPPPQPPSSQLKQQPGGVSSAARGGAPPAESSLPDFLLDDDGEEGGKAGVGATRPPPPPDVRGAEDVGEAELRVSEESVEHLRRQLEAKKRLLRSKREKESAWIDKWRADKAQRQAEIRQIETKLSAVKNSVEEAKARAEAELSQAEARYELEMLEARRRIEEEVKSQFEPQIAELQSKLEAMRKEEAELRAQLDAQGGANDLVQNAITAAVRTILQGIEEKFSKDALKSEEWIKTVEQLVRHEVRSSLAVSADSEAQSEREEQKKNFADILEFWRQAEEEVRDRTQKMDEVLLSDLQSALHEDLARLQKEELSMEEVYIKSREAWASQHQAMLQAEVDAVIQRREAEFAEYRKLRDQIHLERVAGIEHRHQQQMSLEDRMHKEEMERLRGHFAQEEHLNEERQRIAVAAQQDIAKAMESFKGVAASMEAVLTSLKDYRACVDEGRAALESDRQAALTDRQKTLESVRELVTSLHTTIDADYRSLNEASSKLQLAKEQMEELMRSEAVWLTQQEAAYTKSRESWEREYRRWKQLVKQERHNVEERFYETLGVLRDSVAQLGAEEQEIEVQSAAMKRAFAEMESSIAKDIAALQTKQQELQSRKEAMSGMLGTLDQKGEEITRQWHALQEERVSLASEWDALREEESRLQQMAHSLNLVNSQCDATRAQAAAAAEHGRILQQHLSMTRDAVEHGLGRSLPSGSNQKAYPIAPAAHADPSRHLHQPRSANVLSKKDRLPLRTLKELMHNLQNMTDFPEFFHQAAFNSVIPCIESADARRKKRGYAAAPPKANAIASLKAPDPRNEAEIVQRSTSRRSLNRSTSATGHRNSSSPLTEISVVLSSHAGRSLGETFTNLISFSDADSTSHSQFAS